MTARRGLEVWLATVHVPGQADALARETEEQGFDGLSFGDTQGLAADPYVGLALAARVTSRLVLGVRVTNPVTRHPAVTAAAIGSVQVASGGRAVLGVGRGDSSLDHIGMPPAPVDALEAFVTSVQGYLGTTARRLGWLAASGMPKVPLDVAATGPRTISVGARLAEQLTVTVGADVERLRQALALAAEARASVALDPAGLSTGAYVNVVPHPDIRVARDLVRGPAAAYAHFSGTGDAVAGVRPDDAYVFAALRDRYDRSRHGRNTAAHIRFLDDAFVDRFAVVGPPERCAARLAELVGCGLDRLVIVGPGTDGPPDEVDRSRMLLATDVLPPLRAAIASG